MRRYYAGSARQVAAVDELGRSVRFPADILRRYVAHDGVYGRFRIDFDAQGRFREIERLPD